MKSSIFKIVLAGIEIVPQEDNPFLVRAKFIFADNQGNDNNMGIEFEDFPTVAASAIDMPVKMRYLGEGVGNHVGSTPIGHITDMSIDDSGGEVKKLIGTAALYAEEYPDEITYLMDAFQAGDAPGISWELGYSDSVLKNGIQWLKGIVTKAATFVRAPAYGKRTALLALASNQGGLSDAELDEEILKLAKASSIDNTGGNTVNEEELKAKIKALEEALSAKDNALTAALAAKTAEFDTLQTTHNTIVEENKTLKETVATIEKDKRAEERSRKWVEAGFTFEEDAAKAAEKRTFLASLEPDVFESYLADLVTAKASGKPNASASASSGARIPKPVSTAGDQDITLDDLRAQIRATVRS